ncbi:Protein of unknown function [Pelagirhabdus alkalitolerans]|uniref:DUF2922 domain-containing protein n=1 Tax=Pelagirhabdus alkalitolerans TaxID=1612202 RepID=A0A1G6KPF2_9BACI|nr:DUF2922 domain-containing protein [Pelagirhabdus alkalitolerans]SDC32930.1 Protein of unknown function [Pelagirhabdus alkalitolerans]
MKTLELKFTNEDNRVVTISLQDPVESIDPETIRQVMDDMIEANTFFSNGGDLVEKHSARIVERYVEDIEW